MITRILVVDDDKDTADSAALLLQMLGYEITVAYAGSEAVEAARACKPDAVLLDIGMPEMDGFELAERLREETGALLVAVSGFCREADIQRAKAAGIDHYLFKPVDLEQIETVLSPVPKAVTVHADRGICARSGNADGVAAAA